jgi:hypothetical protein
MMSAPMSIDFINKQLPELIAGTMKKLRETAQAFVSVEGIPRRTSTTARWRICVQVPFAVLRK